MLALLLPIACQPAPIGVTDDPQDTDGPSVRPANATCFAPDRPATGADISLQPVYENLSFDGAVEIVQRPGDPSRWYVVEQEGRVWTFDATDDDVGDAQLFLDVTDRVDDSYNEAGLLGMAFHADFATNGEYFLSYTAEGDRQYSFWSRLSRFTSPDRDVDGDETSEEILLEIGQPYDNHDGGSILWGPDGYLYAGFGDGGSGGDPDENGQDTSTLLGKVLRIDPDGGVPYAIPPDNPFADGVGGAPEVYAWGFRNPWRMAFDRETGDLWAGDVGQDRVEEVDLVELGGNYGWNEKEGTECYDAHDPCDGGGYIDPVAQYRHRDGQSVVGGHVYRGGAIPALVGTYLYADFYSGNVWALWYDGEGVAAPEKILTTGFYTSTFGEDADGELYVLDYQGGLHQFVQDEAPAGDDFPTLLSQTGCFDGAEPADALIAYDVNVPLWSDGAEKDRWFALPDDTTIDVDESGDFDFPPRSVLAKTFRLGDTPVETRLFVRHEDGTWAGYTWAWNDAGTDAEHVVGGDTLANGWTLPTPAECMSCHSEAAGRSLGLEVAQLPPDRLADFVEMGLFSGDLPDVDPLPADDARAYLHANCGNCHRPDGPGRGDLDLRYTATDVGGCDEDPQEGDLGIAGVKVIDPGNPSNSVLSLRMHALGAYRMPPIASSQVDEDGVARIDAWISAMTGCP